MAFLASTRLVLTRFGGLGRWFGASLVTSLRKFGALVG